MSRHDRDFPTSLLEFVDSANMYTGGWEPHYRRTNVVNANTPRTQFHELGILKELLLPQHSLHTALTGVQQYDTSTVVVQVP